MQLLDAYFALQSEIYQYFGYTEDWRVIPLEDSREMFWYLEGTGPGTVHYAESEAELESGTGNYYVDDIYTQRHLSQWVYRGEEFTMICCDPATDGNKFLRVFSNSNERSKPV